MIIKTDYVTFDEAFDYLNKHLFEGKLGEVIFTLARKPHCRGYFWFEKFASRTGRSEKASEIALNPDEFKGRDDIEILSTLAHEMVHFWEHMFDKSPRFGYHTKEWADKMEEIGLMPSSTGEHGGKRQGQKMSHYIIEGGEFEKVAGAFLLNHKLEWESIPELKKDKISAKKKSSRIKYTCPVCGINVWAKQSIEVTCTKDRVVLIEEEQDDEEK